MSKIALVESEESYSDLRASGLEIALRETALGGSGLFLKHFGCHALFLLERDSDTLESGLRCQKPIHCIAPKSNFTLLSVIFSLNNTFHIVLIIFF